MAINFMYIFLILTFAGCSSEKETIKIQEPNNIHFFYYVFDDGKEVLKTEKINLSSDADIQAALDSISGRLSEYYSGGTDQQSVKFQWSEISTIKTEFRVYNIAVINIIDGSKLMESKYFQGSTGGMITQNTLMLNTLQPQQSTFLDGAIFLINGRPVPEMDHVNLSGIKIPEGLSHIAQRVVK